MAPWNKVGSVFKWRREFRKYQFHVVVNLTINNGLTGLKTNEKDSLLTK